ncbi:hypothetical protein B7C62_10615 [Kitasatospora albolonga]|uniref:TsaA-like domain-containing protein n=1 Tax=Kitasatospora albolonga TaxID=68173 RepID=A0ABC8BQD9_9ACTN|nr:hypothetical protein B7C62_10615 [Kitasatospora albolonga]
MPTDTFEVRPVAHVVGGHSKPADDFQGGVRSIIRLDEEYPLETLQGIEEFSHLVVTWHTEPSWPTEMLGDYWRDADAR